MGVARLTLTLLACLGASACDLLTPGTDHRIEYSFERLDVASSWAEWGGDSVTHLDVSVVAVNTSRDSVDITPRDCGIPLEAWSTVSAEHHRPTWRLQSRLTWPGSVLSGGCLAILRRFNLAPGETIRLFEQEIPLAEILADSLPAGSYRFEVELTGEVATRGESRTEVRMVEPAEAYLPVSRHPLPLNSYPRDGFHYRVDASRPEAASAPLTVTLAVTHTARYDGSLTRDFSVGCPLQLWGFRSVSERRTIPVPDAAWTWPTGETCAAATAPVQLAPGESWSHRLEVPSEALAESGGSFDDYVLMALIHVDSRPIRIAVDP